MAGEYHQRVRGKARDGNGRSRPENLGLILILQAAAAPESGSCEVWSGSSRYANSFPDPPLDREYHLHVGKRKKEKIFEFL